MQGAGFLAGLRTVVESEADIEIVGQAADGEQALRMLTELRPDIAVIDIGMPKIDGIGLLNEIQRQDLPVAVIFMTMYRAPIDVLAVNIAGNATISLVKVVR